MATISFTIETPASIEGIAASVANEVRRDVARRLMTDQDLVKVMVTVHPDSTPETHDAEAPEAPKRRRSRATK